MRAASTPLAYRFHGNQTRNLPQADAACDWHGHCKIVDATPRRAAASTMERADVHVRQSVRSSGTGCTRSGCSCGRHVSQIEHDRDAAPALQCAPVESEEKRYEGVVASAVMRAMFPAGRRAPRVPEIGRRLDRARRDLAVLPARRPRPRCSRQAAPIEKKDLKVGFIPITCATPIIMAQADGLLREARPQRRRDQDRRLGGDPRQDHQQGIRRRPHAVADAARDHARRRLATRSPTRRRRSRTSTARPSRSRSSTRTSAIRSRGRA